MTQPSINTINLSVIICSRNPRPEFLNETLTALRLQELPMQNWELLLVDNASDPPIKPRFSLTWHPQGRHILEDRLGVTYARLRGIQESRGNVMVYVDDDNVLDPGYLTEALRISQEWPMLGAWGGSVRPKFEMAPPQWTKKLWHMLAIREIHSDQWGNDPNSNFVPFGAGMCFRRSVAEKYITICKTEKLRHMLGEKGTDLSRGEDTDLALTSMDIGLGLGLFKTLTMYHFMPASRLEEKYLLRLIEGSYYSGVWLGYLRNKASGAPRQTLRKTIVNLIEFVIADQRDRRFIFAIAKGKARASREIRNLRTNTELKSGDSP